MKIKIKKLRKIWKPLSRVIDREIQYFNHYSGYWATKEDAFIGFVLSKVSDKLNNEPCYKTEENKWIKWKMRVTGCTRQQADAQFKNKIRIEYIFNN